MYEGFGKSLIFIGVIFIALGVIFLVGRKLGFGALPGDILIRKGNFTFYFPVVSGILLSIILTVILNLIFRR
ncbi:DUF2905 domain-containing protein [Caldanaerobius polysaccharolyticus]|uniref:DUF2905 domain-containing protein n=1 Tax=Caldanaerobius polysaccharolyticus TaxID=44256 RepID=UPI0004792AE5|nr:DUF2905 domain-containing protein [Caldanaerobius polysaccharolyticus]